MGQDLLSPLLLQVHLPVLAGHVLPARQQLGVHHHPRLVYHHTLTLTETGNKTTKLLRTETQERVELTSV